MHKRHEKIRKQLENFRDELNLMRNFFIAVLLFGIGCTVQKEDIPKHIKGTKKLKVYSADAEPNASIEMVREATFGAPDKFSLDWYDETISFYNWLAGIEIDDDGRVFIADNKATKIHVFDADGNYLKSLGGEGSGPGEFQGITDTEIVLNNLHVFDYMGFKTTIYSLDSLQVVESGSVRPPVNQDEVDEISEWLRAVPLLRSDGTYLAGFREQMMDVRARARRIT